jgi:putative endopeptidase
MQKNVRPRSPGRRLTALLALITLAVTIARSAARNIATDDMDISIKPGDDFYRYANGGWLKTNTIPVGQSSYDTRAILAENTSHRVRDLIQNVASARAVKGSIAQKVGDYYASFLD